MARRRRIIIILIAGGIIHRRLTEVSGADIVEVHFVDPSATEEDDVETKTVNEADLSEAQVDALNDTALEFLET